MLAFGVRESVSSPGTVSTGGTMTLVAVTGYPRLQNVPAYWSGSATRSPFAFSVVDSSGLPLAHGLGRLTAAATLTVDRWLQSFVSSTYADASLSSVALGASPVFVLGAAGPWSARACMATLNAETTANPSTFGRRRVSGHIGALGSSYALSANTLYFAPYRSEYGGEVSSIGIPITAVAAGKSIRLGLFACDAVGKPGALLAETGALSVASTGDVSGSVTSIAIPPGYYWIGMVSDGTPSIRSGTIGDYQLPVGMADWGYTGRSVPRALYYSYTFGAMPSSGPAMSSMTVDAAPYNGGAGPAPVLEFAA